MLSDRNIRQINDDINRELREARMSFDHDEKLQCLERVAALQAVLSPQPSRQQLLKELAEAIAEATNATSPTDPNEFIIDLGSLFRRRR